MCKSWDGHAVSVEELHSILKAHPNQKDKIVGTELIYLRESKQI